MRRADRLFQIAQYLRGRRLTTAQQLADWLKVSVRTIYRDIQDLSLSGVPVEGEAGVGYRITHGYELPPLTFSPDELDALVAGMRMVQAWGGPQLAASGAAVLSKVAMALPKEKRNFVEATALFAPSFQVDKANGERLETIRQAIAQKRWGDFFQHIIPKLKEGALSYGVYSQYESDFNGEFDVLAGADSASVLDAADREGLDSVVIAVGTYLVFSKKGAMPQAVIEAWGDVWAYFSAKDCPHQRAYTTDFECYSNMDEVSIHISIL